MTTKLIAQLKKVTGMDNFPFISAGVAVDENLSGHVISEDALTALVEATTAGETAAARVVVLEGNVTAANSARDTAVNNLATANATIATRDTRITELEARVAELEEENPITQSSKEKDETGKGSGTPYHASAENPLNKMADRLMGKPKPKTA